MSYVVWGAALALAGAFAYAAAEALRSRYLLVVNWRDRDYFFLERGEDGKYALVRFAWVPLAVGRFAWRRLATASGQAARQVPGGANLARALHREGRARAAHV